MVTGSWKIKVIKIYMVNGRQKYFDVEDDDGIMRGLLKRDILELIRCGYVFMNATISDRGVVRVEKYVPRIYIR